MKRIAWLLLLLLCWTWGAAAQEERFSPDFEMRYWEVLALPEGGFLFVGALDAPGERDANATAIWTDAQGKTLSTLRLHPQEQAEILESLTPIDGGGYAALLGPQGEDERGQILYRLVTFEEGRILSDQVIPTADFSIIPSLLPAKGGFFAFTGDRVDKDKRNANFHVPALTLYDTAGERQWRHVFDAHEWVASYALPVSDGTLLFGSIEEQKTGKRNSHAVAAKMSEQGELLWMTESPGRRWKAFRGAAEMPGGDYFVVGEHSDDPGPGVGGLSDQPVVARLSPGGELLWEKEIKLDLEVVNFTGVLALDEGYLVNVREVEYMPPARLYLLDEAGDILREYAYPLAEGINLERQTLLRTPQGPCLIWSGYDEAYHTRKMECLYPKL